MKSFSEACERNKDVILSTIKPLLCDKKALLEIGSGNGQHAVYFSKYLPWLTWQTSDCVENHSDIDEWVDDYGGDNIKRPLALNVLDDPWPKGFFDAIYSANTAHIMSWRTVQGFFAGVGNILRKDGLFILYGPFNYNGTFTSESNRKFEDWLKNVDPKRGIRDFEAVDQLAQASSLSLVDDIEMPANNRILVWKKMHTHPTSR